MPIAMQKFTMADRERKAAKRASIAEMKENPPPTSAAADYFTAKAREEKAARDAEIKAMKENPQPTTVAGAHFNEIEKVRKAEMQELIDNPPPMSEAHAYFTAKDKEEKKRMAEVEKAREDKPNPNIVATAHFDRIENEKKMAKMESIRKAREEVLAAGPVESLAIDHFTKENEALAELERRMAVDKLDDAAVATKYFTLKGKEDEKARREAQEALSAQERSVAAAYFMRKAAEEKENPKSGGESEVMPIAIQKFTMADRERKAAKRASIAEMKENPPPTSAAADYFTAKAREEKAARDAEIKAMKENPQPTTVAGAHFNEIEKVRKAEMQELIDNPPPMSEAHAYFTAKDKEEKKRMAEVEKAREDRPNPNIVATAHFD